MILIVLLLIGGAVLFLIISIILNFCFVTLGGKSGKKRVFDRSGRVYCLGNKLSGGRCGPGARIFETALR
jgi:hypothetical protein